MPIDEDSENYIRRHTRGFLPHYDSPSLIQFVTFRLADSLPVTFFKTLDFRLKSKQITEIEYHRQIEKALDLGEGPTYLIDERVTRIVAETIVKFDGEKYELRAWVVMPNHVHLLMKTIKGHTLSQGIHSIKGYTASAANKLLGRSGRFWSPDYFDRFIRGEDHYLKAKKYIEENPVKAGLCAAPEDWPWGSEGFTG